ncbi:MAG TPA: hypothetical protein VGM37_10360 [Armatimonadota bacterium]
MKPVSLAVCLSLLVVPMSARSSPNRLYLAEQYDYGAARGFFLDFENDASSGPCRLSSLQLIVGVGDGANWRFISHTPVWQYDHVYTAAAVVRPSSCELWLDGVRVGVKSGASRPATGDLTVNDIPSWAAGPAEYMVVQSGLTASSSDGASAAIDLSVEASRPAPIMLMAPKALRRAAWSPSPTRTQSYTATFRLIPTPDPRAYDPYVDRYGQSRYAEFPGKVTQDADMANAAADETSRLNAWGLPAGYDAYGGSLVAGWTDSATGYFRTVKRNGFWWLVTPSGNPCFYLGVCDAPALTWEMTPVSDRAFLFAELPSRASPYSAGWATDVWGEGQGTLYSAFHTANMIRKYGASWQSSARASTYQRVRTLGFGGLAKWSDTSVGVPWIPVLNRAGVPNLVRHPDIFNANIRAQLKATLAAQVAPFKANPMVLGCTVSSEHDEIITPEEVTGMLSLGATVPAKAALVDYAVSSLYGGSLSALAAAWRITAASQADAYAAVPTPPAADVEALRRYFADQYYGFLYTTMKEVDPHHLYLGNWIVPGWWVNEEDWRLIARHCDVIGIDNYAFRFADARVARLIRESNRPVFVGEFSFPPSYRGVRGFGTYSAAYGDDEPGSAALYGQYVRDAAANPFCVGLCWFEYRDQPITGRGAGRGAELVYGEDYAFGLVDMTDRLKWDLVSPMRDTNLAAVGQRVAANAAFRPLTLSARALRIAGGLQPGAAADVDDLDTVSTGASLGRVDMADAVALAARGL